MPVHLDHKGHVGLAPDPVRNFSRNISSRLNVVARLRGTVVGELPRLMPPGPELQTFVDRANQLCDDMNAQIRTQTVPANLGTNPAQRPQ